MGTSTVTKVYESPVLTRWLFDLDGKQYLATTYPDSKVISIQTAKSLRTISKYSGPRVHARIRELLGA